MTSEINHLRKFGKFRLDAEKRVLWCEDKPVNLPLKEIELLCVLTENGGEVVTKDELMEKVWADSFVEESNLSRHIYVLRKTFKDFGEERELIQTVPRRGYRFAGEVRKIENGNGELVIERHALTRTLVEIEEAEKEPDKKNAALSRPRAAALAFAAFFAVALIAAGLAIWNYQNSPAKTSPAEIKSIAVLPLKSFAQNNEDEELRLRITDALITRLGNFNQIAVRPTSAVLRFADKETDALEAGRKLAVDSILDGRIQREGERVRVTLQMLSVSGGEQIWSEQFDGNANQILNLQDAISAKVSQTLSARAQKPLPLVARPTENAEAFEAYLKGRYLWNKRSGEGIRKSIDFFQQAIALDSGFALAYAGLADAYCLLPEYGGAPTGEAYPLANRAASEALKLNENSVEALTSLGFIHYWWLRDEKSSEKSFLRAIELNPNYVTARHWYANVLHKQKRLAEGAVQMREARRLDPTSITINVELAILSFYEHKFDEAEKQSRAALDIDAQSLRARSWLGRTLLAQQRYDEALHEFQKVIESNPKAHRVKAEIAFALARSNRQREAENYLNEMIALYPNQSVAFELAMINAGLDREQEAIEWLKKTLTDLSFKIPHIEIEPVFDQLHDSPEFAQLVSEKNDLFRKIYNKALR
jgi:DNA-binding winged helix-turn-helix (wHTH) protein/TolB-like protein/cytochrome c-type biogenesis protein CcmH/NrfG